MVEHLQARGEVTGGTRGKVYCVCPKKAAHNPDHDVLSSTAWLLATATEPARFHCAHESHGRIGTTEFLDATGFYPPVIDEFAVVTTDAEQQAADAIARAKNADKAANEMPRLVLETAPERAKRTERERERSRAIGDGAASLPVQGVMTGTEMLEDLVFLSEGSRVSCVSDPRFVLTFGDFKATTEASTTFVKSPSGRTLKKSKASLC